MKPYIFRFLAICMLFAAVSCDEVSEKNRYIDVPAVKVERTVLLEDFTGQNCINCPGSHRIVEALEQQYGDHLIAVSIHAGEFSIPADNKRLTGLMQPDGQVYNDRYGIDGYPSGVVDGHMPPITNDKWASAVYDDIRQTTPLTIGVEARLIGGDIAVSCNLSSTEKLDGTLYMWIVESGIVAYQKDKDAGFILDYVHNNVFRACVNGVDGSPVNLAIGEPTTVNGSIAVKNTDTEKWNVDELAVVAFVKNNSGVVQAARCGVTVSEKSE